VGGSVLIPTLRMKTASLCRDSNRRAQIVRSTCLAFHGSMMPVLMDPVERWLILMAAVGLSASW
jgi:hypothetical protein